MVLRAAIGLLSFILLLPAAALADKRIALVIGNGAYVKVPKLENPKNDTAAMEAMLKAAGFDIVVRGNDLGVVAMRRALRDFSDMAHDADIAVVFYAGHGMEVSGTNYLIPTDAVLERDIDVQDEAVPLDRVSQILEPVKRLRFIILDACRDNPFVRSMRRTLATRTVRSGYGEIDEKSLPPNTLVAYAQRAGATAEDGAGANSPYTTALLKHLPTPGLDVELALRRVRDDVLKTTRNRQEPFKYGSLGGTEVALVTAKSPQPAPEPRVATGLSEAAEVWDRVKDGNSLAVLEAFITRFKETFYAEMARARIEELKKHQVAMAAPQPASKSSACEGMEITVGANERRCMKPGAGKIEWFKDCRDCPEMVVVPAGEFAMGLGNTQGRPVQQVSIPKPIAVGRYEVAFAEWDACVTDGGCKRYPVDQGWGRGRQPIINVSWEDAKEFVAWLTKKTRKTYRLLLDLEWEYAARAGSTHKYTWGEEIGTNRANCIGCGSQWDSKGTSPIGSFQPNAFGIYDMHGNVNEWVEDCSPDSTSKEGSARSDPICAWHIVRGGSWRSKPENLGSTGRWRFDRPGLALGFRVARTLD